MAQSLLPPKIHSMSTITGESSAGSASEANAAIRAFMTERAGRGLMPEEQAEYEQLLDTWAFAAQQATTEPS